KGICKMPRPRRASRSPRENTPEKPDMLNVVQTGRAAVACATVTGLVLAVGAGSATGPTNQSPVERGKYLVTISACSDCHTPMKIGLSGPEPDMQRYLRGHPP